MVTLLSLKNLGTLTQSTYFYYNIFTQRENL